MNKIGLLSVKTHNYGSLLQTFALQKVLFNLGYENEIIDYKKTNMVKQALRLLNIPLLKQIASRVQKKIFVRLLHPELSILLNDRTESFNEFIGNLRFSKTFIGRKALEKGSTQYDAFVLGSDQVWNPMNYGADFFSMTFIKKGIKKISYAPSFGVSKIPNYQKRYTSCFLNDIDFLSVREISGQKLIYELTGRESKIVVDPTILLGREYWDDLRGKRIINDPYIMCYFLGSNANHRMFANRLKKNTGYKIVTLPHMDEIVKSDFGFGDLIPRHIGPKEFVNLVSNANYVCTDSFHGTVFSILYKRNFFTFNRYPSKKKDSTNSRLDSILTMTNLANRKMDSSIDITDEWLKPINYLGLDERIEKMRNDSIDFLVKALTT